MSGEIRTYKINHVKASLIGNLIENFLEMFPMHVETITSKALKPIRIWVNTAANTIVIGINPLSPKTTKEQVEETWKLIERLIAENDIVSEQFQAD
ncbi:hypothetical protein ACFL27_21455 [candidate division CSSED10-310 bacterium]|uniref:DUF59 domain-containing protein n=1 Tax=candidate division CSSED10-310 bacterium TaxID=2855610 RepID=A0ABV6Z2U0_UNCC1